MDISEQRKDISLGKLILELIAADSRRSYHSDNPDDCENNSAEVDELIRKIDEFVLAGTSTRSS